MSLIGKNLRLIRKIIRLIRNSSSLSPARLPLGIHRIGIAAAGVGEGGDAFCECSCIGLEFALKYLLAVYENRDCALGVKETLVKENAQLSVG